MGVREKVFLWGGGSVFEGLIQAFLKRYRQQAVQHIQGLCVAFVRLARLFRLRGNLERQPLVPVRRSDFAYQMQGARRPFVHRIGVGLVAVSGGQAIRQGRERRSVSVANLIYLPAYVG